MTSLSNVQAAVVAAVGQVIALIVAFGLLNNTVAGALTSATTAVIAAGFVVGQAIENHAKARSAPAPAPTKAS